MSEMEAVLTPFHSLQVPTLPCELISRIPGYLKGVSKFKTLLSMCLVSRHWYNATRRHLFKSIQIYTEQRFSELLALLEANPFISGWFKEVELLMNTMSMDFFYKCPGKLIGRLPSVRKLTIFPFPNLMDPLRTAKALKDFSTAFPRFTELEFWEFTFTSFKELVGFVCGFPELKSLTLCHCADLTWSQGEEDEQVRVRKDKNQTIEESEDLVYPPNLTSLRINIGFDVVDSMTPLVLGLSTSPLINHVHKLSFFFWDVYHPYHPSYMKSVGGLLKNIGPSLQHLDIGTGRGNQGTSDIISLRDRGILSSLLLINTLFQISISTTLTFRRTQTYDVYLSPTLSSSTFIPS